MDKRRNRRTGQPSIALARVTAEQLADDLGVSLAEVRRHLHEGIRAGWVSPVTDGVWALRIPVAVQR